MPLDTSRPYLSVILPSRNDDYSGGTLPRLKVCAGDFVAQAERHRLRSELILVDWNPPRDRSGLRDALQWPAQSEFCSVRVIEVPPEIHAPQRFSDKLPILVHRARNVGIRRARGRFAVPIGSDVIFSDALVRYLAAGQLEVNGMYRTDRHDVPEDTLGLSSLEQRLAYCEKNVVGVRETDDLNAVRTGRSFEASQYRLGASGDFTLLSEEMWRTLRGVPEEIEFHSACFDNLFCYMALAAGANDVVLRDPIRLFHINHPSVIDRSLRVQALALLALPYGLMRRLAPRRVPMLARRLERLVYKPSRLDSIGVPRISTAQYWETVHEMLEGKRDPTYNGESWGLGDEDLPDTVVMRAKWEHPS